MEYPKYKYPVGALHTGSSLGNYRAFARLNSETNLRGLWSSIDNQYYAGGWDIEIHVNGKGLPPTETIFTPESQTTLMSDGQFHAEKQFLLPYSLRNPGGENLSPLQAAIYLVRFTNPISDHVNLLVRHSLFFPAKNSPEFTKQPSEDQMFKRMDIRRTGSSFDITTLGKPSEARVFGASLQPTECGTDDKAMTLEYHRTLRGGESVEIPFVLAFSGEGVACARNIFSRCKDARALLNESISSYRELLGTSQIMTPEPMINRGLQWAKVNTVRVQHQYRAGMGFTNDPPQDIVVIRDLAWYVLGSDYLTPEFSSGLLALAGQHAFHEGGKLTEYLHADEDPPVPHDYHLNINDDTPLFVFAVHHHAVACADESRLQGAYQVMKRACDWIISQMNAGLVWCHSEGTNVWGICGWRNIIDGYNLSGAVTEVNSECYAALKCTAEIASRLEKKSEAEFYRRIAEQIKQAINTTLLSERTGFYLLSLGNDGTRHHDVTGDLIFPVIFGVAGEGMRRKILEKLTHPEMWLPYGTRTVSRREENYDPDSSCQLLGGLWPNLTAWIAYCIRGEQPDKLVEGMLNIYRLSETERPVDFRNVVPGEFPERLHGESAQSMGMAMSPWMPPTYLWLGVEGLLGVKPAFDGFEMNPALPENWRWIAVKNLQYRGYAVTAFLYDGILYATRLVLSRFPVKVGSLVDTLPENEKIFSIGIEVEGSSFLFIACDEKIAGPLTIRYGAETIRRDFNLQKGEAVLLLLKGLQKPDPRQSMQANQ